MSCLQDPVAALAQAEWYLTHADQELFPGAFELAAGNLCRQSLEQALFILSFFSGMPQGRYLRPDRRLHTAGKMLRHLDEVDPVSHLRYWAVARRCGPRIAKIANQRRTTARWARLLNEPSHFSARHRAVGPHELHAFIDIARRWFDDKDKHLIVAILNDICSRGRIRATLSDDQYNTPGVSERVEVSARDLTRDKAGRLSLVTPEKTWVVISDREVPRGPWPRRLVIVEHSTGIHLGAQLVTRKGKPVDLTNMSTVLGSLASTRGERGALARRLRQLGFEIRLGPPATPCT